MRRRTFLVLWCSVVGILGFAAEGCKQQKSPDPTGKYGWSTSMGVVQRNLPFLGPIVECSWSSGVAVDNDYGLVPGPDIVYLRGYAVLTEEDANRIGTAYAWTKSNDVRPSDLKMPPGGPSLSGDVLVSEQFEQELSKVSAYGGRLYLLRDLRIVYFDLER